MVAQLPSNHALGTEVFLAFDCTKDLGQTLTVPVVLETGWALKVFGKWSNRIIVGGTELDLTKINDHLRRKKGLCDIMSSYFLRIISRTVFLN